MKGEIMRSWHVALTSIVAVVTTVGVASTPIKIGSYEWEVNRATGEVLSYGQRIVHPDFDVQLGDKIVKVPIFSIQYKGLHHVEGTGQSRVEARTKCVAERLTAAFDILDQGGRFEVHPDDWNKWRLKASSAPTSAPAIYVVHPKILKYEPLRVITIYPGDVEAYANAGSQQRLAEYVVALIEAHYLLFWKKSPNIEDYEALELDKRTREGKIFKEIFLRTQDVTRLKNQPRFTDEDLRDALGRISLPQRERLVKMAFVVPVDW